MTTTETITIFNRTQIAELIESDDKRATFDKLERENRERDELEGIADCEIETTDTGLVFIRIE